MTQGDPFSIPPDLWLGVLCEAVSTDERGRINLERVFNQTRFLEPPSESGVAPHAHLRGIVVIGLSKGLGEFHVELALRDMDDNLLWALSEPVTLRLGPGEAGGGLIARPVDHWLTSPGSYYYAVRLRETDDVWRIHFEATPTPAPDARLGDAEGETR